MVSTLSGIRFPLLPSAYTSHASFNGDRRTSGGLSLFLANTSFSRIPSPSLSLSLLLFVFRFGFEKWIVEFYFCVSIGCFDFLLIFP